MVESGSEPGHEGGYGEGLISTVRKYLILVTLARKLHFIKEASSCGLYPISFSVIEISQNIPLLFETP